MGIRTRRAHKHASTHAVAFGIAGFFGFCALLAVTIALSLASLIGIWLQDLPNHTTAEAYLLAEPTRVFDAEGNEIVAYYLQNRRSVDLEKISDYVKKGTIDTEDKRFYQHNGVDPQGILRAVVGQLFRSGAEGGGSTITQQLVRNTVLSDEQFELTLRRKIREAYISIQMEKQFTKDQILNMYLNTIYYGNGAYGIEAASITYFNKSADSLTLAEAATLVGLPNGPGLFDPIAHPEACKQRRNLVLSRMLEAGHITEEECQHAQAEDLNLNRGRLSNSIGIYPFFTDYVRKVLLQDFSAETIQQGGLKVYTTLNPHYQQLADKAAYERVSSANNKSMAAALVSIDNSNGHIVAMVGGQNYGYNADAGQSTYNLATSALRQAGSSFKTMTLVAAMREGMNPSVRLDCRSPMQIDKNWAPKNYANNQYGIITLDRATQLSSNTAYGQVIEAIGVDSLIETSKLMGISSNIKPYLSSTLGASEVTVLEMAEAYSTLASGGKHRKAIAITKIEDRNGNVVYEHKDDPQQAIEPGVAADATTVLQNVVRAGYTTNYVAAYFNANQPVAGKTGTSDEADNLWFCGYSPQLTTAVWVGNPRSNVAVYYRGSLATTSNTAQPIWTNYMNAALSGLPRAEFPRASTPATYKANSSWTFVGTAAVVNTEGWVDPAEQTEEEEEDTEEQTDPSAVQTTPLPALPTPPSQSDASTQRPSKPDSGATPPPGN